MNEDNIEKLFERMKGKMDIQEPSLDHKAKFLEKLQRQNGVVPISSRKRRWPKIMAIAASVAILLGIATTAKILNTESETAELASISPQMEETQSFFTSAIQSQLEEIDKVSSHETDVLVNDALELLKKLESDYENLKKDLVRSGNDKRVISAMIKNFQKRANLLEEVLQKINEINELKLSQNESSIL